MPLRPGAEKMRIDLMSGHFYSGVLRMLIWRGMSLTLIGVTPGLAVRRQTVIDEPDEKL